MLLNYYQDATKITMTKLTTLVLPIYYLTTTKMATTKILLKILVRSDIEIRLHYYEDNYFTTTKKLLRY